MFLKGKNKLARNTNNAYQFALNLENAITSPFDILLASRNDNHVRIGTFGGQINARARLFANLANVGASLANDILVKLFVNRYLIKQSIELLFNNLRCRHHLKEQFQHKKVKRSIRENLKEAVNHFVHTRPVSSIRTKGGGIYSLKTFKILLYRKVAKNRSF